MMVLVSNIEFLAQKLSLVDPETNQTVVSFVFDRIRDAISIIDSFSASASSAVFVFWGFIGIVAFSITMSISQAYMEFRRNIDIANNFYHPEGYSGQKFWAGVFKETAIKIGLFTTVVASFIYMLAWLLPNANESLRVLVNVMEVGSGIIFILWSLALWLCLAIFVTSAKLAFIKS